MKQKALLVSYQADVTELNEYLEDGWTIVSCTPQRIVSTTTTMNNITVGPFQVAPILVILLSPRE